MHHIHQELWSSAFRQARRAKRTTGRIVVSALGFGAAYYLDAENGGARREQLRRAVRRAATRVDAALAPGVEDPPDFTPLLHGLGDRAQPRVARLARRAESN